MYNKDELKSMRTIENNLAYGTLKVDTDETRVYIDENDIVTVETFVNGYDENYWDVDEQY